MAPRRPLISRSASVLQADIHGQAQRLAGVGGHGFEHTHHIAVSIFFHFLIAGCAVKLALIKLSSPDLPIWVLPR